MESDNLYRVQEEDLPRLQKLLTVCFAQDPLYHTLIPDDDIFSDALQGSFLQKF